MEKTEGRGERIGGYRVVRRLATGDTSDVLLAKAEGPHGFERTVVLKLLLSQYKHDDEVKGMFAREAAAYARLSHPSIVRLYDFFANDGQLVMVLEYIDGPPLSLLRGMLKAVGQTFDDVTSLFIAGSVFEALAAAHAANDESGEPAPVIHRDVNPSNVLISWDGQVKLADFGIAKVTGVSHQSTAGLIRGTFGYMAPEQVKGETVTPRADVYAGGLILWEMLTKRRAFIRGALPEIEVLRELAAPRIVSIDVLRPDLDKSVRDALKRALEPRAEKRNMTAEEMVSILRAVVPADEGRERLAKTLASVRHEPRPSSTSMPPPLEKLEKFADEPETGKIFPRGAVPAKPGLVVRRTPAPRPAAGVPRKTASYRVAAHPSGTAPRPEEEPDSETVRVGTALPGFAPGTPLHDAIDEILRDIPSNLPPNVFPRSDLPDGGPELPTRKDQKTLAEPLTRAIGQIPPAPAPLGTAAPRNVATLAIDTGQPIAPRGIPSSFPAMNRTLSMSDSMSARLAALAPPSTEGASPAVASPAVASPAEKPSERPAPHLMVTSTASMPPVPSPALSLSTERMAALVMPQDAEGAAPPPAATTGSLPPAPPKRRGTPTLAFVAVVLLAVAGGVAAGVGYLRWQRSHMRAARLTPTPTAADTGLRAAAPAASAAPPASASARASASAPVSATARASASAPASALAVPSASADAAAPAPASAEDVPAGMGRVKTAGATPGRRIFVDEKTVGQTPEAVVVRCGSRTVKLGSAGATQTIDVPCGGEITVGDR